MERNTAYTLDERKKELPQEKKKAKSLELEGKPILKEGKEKKKSPIRRGKWGADESLVVLNRGSGLSSHHEEKKKKKKTKPLWEEKDVLRSGRLRGRPHGKEGEKKTFFF